MVPQEGAGEGNLEFGFFGFVQAPKSAPPRAWGSLQWEGHGFSQRSLGGNVNEPEEGRIWTEGGI